MQINNFDEHEELKYTYSFNKQNKYLHPRPLSAARIIIPGARVTIHGARVTIHGATCNNKVRAY